MNNIEQLKTIVGARPDPLLFATVSGAHIPALPDVAGLYTPKETIQIERRRWPGTRPGDA